MLSRIFKHISLVIIIMLSLQGCTDYKEDLENALKVIEKLEPYKQMYKNLEYENKRIKNALKGNQEELLNKIEDLKKEKTELEIQNKEIEDKYNKLSNEDKILMKNYQALLNKGKLVREKIFSRNIEN